MSSGFLCQNFRKNFSAFSFSNGIEVVSHTSTKFDFVTVLFLVAEDACLLRSLLLNAWRGEKAEPFLILEEYDDDDDNAEQQHLQIPRIDVVVVIIAGSTRVFSPLFFCGEGGEEEKRVRYQITNTTFFIETCFASLVCLFWEERTSSLSFKTWLKFRFLAHHRTRQKKATQNYKNDRRKKFVRSKRKGERKF